MPTALETCDPAAKATRVKKSRKRGKAQPTRRVKEKWTPRDGLLPLQDPPQPAEGALEVLAQADRRECRSGTARRSGTGRRCACSTTRRKPIGGAYRCCPRRSYIDAASTRGRSRKSNNFKFLVVDGAEVERKVLMRTRRVDGAEGNDRHPRETGLRLNAPPTARRGRADNAGRRRGRG